MRPVVLTRGALGTALALAAPAMVAPAHAEGAPPVFAPAADTLRITLPGARAASPRALASGDRIEIALDAAVTPSEREVRDTTVRRIAVLGPPRPALVVTLEHGRATTARIAAATRIEQSDAGLLVELPRKGALVPVVRSRSTPATDAAPSAPEASASAPSPPVSDPAEPAAAPVAELTEASAAVASSPAPSFLDVPAPGTPAAALPAGVPSATRPLLLTLLLAAGGLALAGAWRRKRRAQHGPSAGVELVSQRHLGGKSRVVLLRVRGRELLVGVADQRLSLLDSWDEGEARGMHAEAEEHLAGTLTTPEAQAAPSRTSAAGDRLRALLARRTGGPGAAAAPDELTPAPARATSPLISGILKLKQRRHPGLHPDTWSGSAEDDREWARALAEATDARGRESRLT